MSIDKLQGIRGDLVRTYDNWRSRVGLSELRGSSQEMDREESCRTWTDREAAWPEKAPLVEFGTFSILFWFISVPVGISFVFLSHSFSTICMFFNILVFFYVFAHAAVFSFTIDVNKNRSCVINLHRVALSRPTAPIQCKFSVVMFIASRFKSLFSYIYFCIL